MADNKNIELNDEMIAKASGGTVDEGSAPRFNIGDLVYQSDGNGSPITTEIVGKILRYEEGGSGWVYDVEFIQHPTNPGLVIEGLDEYLLVPV